MRGVPKHCNTKADYEYLRNNYPEDVWRPAFQRLYDDRLQEFNRGIIPEGEEGIVDNTHSVVEEQDMNGGTVRYQFEKAVNPEAFMFRIGFTEEELAEILK